MACKADGRILAMSRVADEAARASEQSCMRVGVPSYSVLHSSHRSSRHCLTYESEHGKDGCARVECSSLLVNKRRMVT